ncbi:hypothetical protein [Streptomyces sp. NPDC088246]
MAAETCAAMAMGGMCDLLGGGFARYSVDREWHLKDTHGHLVENSS